MQDITNALESAVKTTIDAAGFSITVLAGQSGETKELPAVRVYAADGREEPSGSGNFHLTLEVEVRSNAADTALADHRTMCRNVFGVMMQDDLAATLSAAESDFLAFGFHDRQASENREDDSWISTLKMDVYCASIDG